MINCCVVDDHCDIVPFIHSFWRAKKVKHNQKVVFVHFDAHPDLSVPSSKNYSNSLSSWQDPETLYDILNDEGGIAEFILPLVSTKLLSQVIWIRSDWCEQLPDGEVIFLLKDKPNSKTCKTHLPGVTYKTAYYLDEGVYCCNDCISNVSIPSAGKKRKSECTLARENNHCTVNLITTTTTTTTTTTGVNLHGLHLNPVSQLYSTVSPHSVRNNHLSVSNIDTNDSTVNEGAELDDIHEIIGSSTNGPKSMWILDICLDYFSTVNPFLVKVMQSIEIDLRVLTGSQWNDLPYLLTVKERPSLQNRNVINDLSIINNESSVEVHTTTQQVIEIVKNAYKYLAFRLQTGDDTAYVDQLISKLRTSCSTNSDDYCDCDNMNLLRTHTNDTMNTLLLTTDHRKLNSTVMDNYLELYCPSQRKQGQSFIDLLSHLSKETKQIISDTNYLLLLPHHVSTDAEIDTLIEQMILFIQHTFMNREVPSQDVGLPMLITIARSSASDEYTPQCQVDKIQGKVLVAVNNMIKTYRHYSVANMHTDDNVHVVSINSNSKITDSVCSSDIPVLDELVIHDMCEDAHDKCYNLFRNKLHLKSDKLPTMYTGTN